jgi:hypothetical protein
MAQTDGGRVAEAATVTREVAVPPRDLKTLRIACGECGGEVDRVEWNDAPVKVPPAVESIMGTLGVSERKAREIVKESNPEALVSERDGARALAEAIVSRSVPDRPADTYVCALGHADAALEIKS